MAPLIVPLNGPLPDNRIPVPVTTTAPLPVSGPVNSVLYERMVSVFPFTSIAPPYELVIPAPRVSEVPSFRSALQTKFTPISLRIVTSPVSVSGLPLIVYAARKSIGPTLNPAGRSLVIVAFDAPLGKKNFSPATGIVADDQFPGFDHAPLIAPVHDFGATMTASTTSLP